MDSDREFRHVCKFCSKSFPCGRSLGGHMRSHLTKVSSDRTDDNQNTKKKLQSINNGVSKTNTEANYGLRENPKKTWRIADSSEETSLHDKLCRECGKGFQSWKALFGHMKCHSEKEKLSNSLDEQESWASANHKQGFDSQSENENAAPNRRKRSKRRTRCMVIANSSSLSLAYNGSSSVSETEQEQEEIAMCLIMLSRDVGHWDGLNSVAESSDNNSVFLESKKMKEKKVESGVVSSENFPFEEGKKSELCASEISRNVAKMNRCEISINELLKNDRIKNSQLENKLKPVDFEVELGKNLIKQDKIQVGSSKCSPSKRKLWDSYNPEFRSDSLKISTTNASDSELGKDSNKFECATCNKVFHSYQALGGHRASHKKIKGCLSSKVDSNENSVEAGLSPDQTSDIKLMKSFNNESSFKTSHFSRKSKAQNDHKGHECPICLKVFPSGQALGGHKRSHLVTVSANETSNNSTTVIQKPVPEIRDLLDLNLPAPEEEEDNGHLGFSSWWTGGNHKHEALLGLISN